VGSEWLPQPRTLLTTAPGQSMFENPGSRLCLRRFAPVRASHKRTRALPVMVVAIDVFTKVHGRKRPWKILGTGILGLLGTLSSECRTGVVEPRRGRNLIISDQTIRG
jgi:hypothetical protein